MSFEQPLDFERAESASTEESAGHETEESSSEHHCSAYRTAMVTPSRLFTPTDIDDNGTDEPLPHRQEYERSVASVLQQRPYCHLRNQP